MRVIGRFVVASGTAVRLFFECGNHAKIQEQFQHAQRRFAHPHGANIGPSGDGMDGLETKDQDQIKMGAENESHHLQDDLEIESAFSVDKMGSSGCFRQLFVRVGNVGIGLGSIHRTRRSLLGSVKVDGRLDESHFCFKNNFDSIESFVFTFEVLGVALGSVTVMTG